VLPRGCVVDGSERLRGLDAMRALVVLGLIFFHSTLIFDRRDDYYVKNGQTADLTALAALGVVWAMPLLFLTAGLAVWHSLDRRTVAAVAGERMRRLLVPLVFGVLVLMPIPVWFRLRADPAYAESYAEFYPRFLQVRPEWSNFPFVVQGVPPDDLFETGQLWFLVLLLTFSLLLLPAFWWLRRRPGQGLLARLAPAADRPGAILLPAIPLGLTSAAFHLEEPHAAWSRWSYLLFFVYGFVLASDRRYLSAMQRHTAAAITMGLATFVVGFGLIAAAAGDPFVDYQPLSVVGRFLFGVTGWLWLVAILGLLTRPRPDRNPAGSTRRSTAITGWVGEAVLPVYVLHQPVLVAIAYYVVRWDLHPLVKYLAITTGTLLIVLGSYHLLIRPVPPARLLFGLRPTPTAAAPPAGRPVGPPSPR
jgi:peptidoglycan/LPS O-acetylase OafA/YrhL